MSWQELSLAITSDDCESISEFLEDNGALSVSIESDNTDDPLFQVSPEESPLWNTMRVRALFDASFNLNLLINKLPSAFKKTVQTKIIEEQDWVSLTQKNFPPLAFANKKFMIYPPWFKEKKQTSSITIDPGLAFGTGTHPTTAMIIEYLAMHDCTDKAVIDYGCGSGILALAAAKLGASSVLAIDHDEQAVTSSKNNLKLNPELSDKIQVQLDDVSVHQRANLVIANILANPLIELAPLLIKLTEEKGTLLLSGILAVESEHVIKAYQPAFESISVTQQKEWVMVEFKR